MNLTDLFIARAYAEESDSPYISFNLEARFHKIGTSGWIALGVLVLFALIMLVIVLSNKKSSYSVASEM